MTTTDNPADLHKLPAHHLIDPDTAARVLNVSVETLSVWRCTGRYHLPYLKVGRRVFYRAGDIRAWLESRVRLHTGKGA